MNKLSGTVALLFITLINHAYSNQPKLIVQLVVDQLRGDLIYQHKQQFGNTGFNYLLNHGLDFHNAHHPHANTTTCAGHATIATGTYPSMHGVVDNEWYDRKTEKMVYCMEDLKSSLLPTQHTHKQGPGRSPRNLYASTLSDEVVLAKKGRAFAVSLKDRSAITLAGHAGKAFWFDKTNGGFVTSSFYYAKYPQWVSKWNSLYKPNAFSWELSRPKSDYQNEKNATFEHDYKSFGQTFPHHVSNPPSEDYFHFLAETPKADQLTADFAEQLLISEHLGSSTQDTDYLAISFSAGDVIGHQFGPNSLEAEDNLLVLDQTIAHLLAVIDKQVGLNNALIILTADHGVEDSPSYLKTNHIKEIKPINKTVLAHHIRELLSKRYKLPKEALMAVEPPYVYLNHHIINDRVLNLTEVSQYIAQELNLQPGIFKAFPLPVSDLEKDWLKAKVNKMAYPERAGDVYMIPPPYQTLGMDNENRITHGSPWRYDSYVPLIFTNPDFKALVISRPVQTTDIASTLAALLMIKQPTAAVGKPLQEVLAAFKKSDQGERK